MDGKPPPKDPENLEELFDSYKKDELGAFIRVWEDSLYGGFKAIAQDLKRQLYGKFPEEK